MVATRLVTAAELLAMGSGADHTELVEGVLVEMSPANRVHGRIASDLHGYLWTHVRAHDLGELYVAETGFIVARNPDSVLVPDIAFVEASRLDVNQSLPGFVPFAPDLAIEIESPSNTRTEFQRKIKLYFGGGARLIWLVRPIQRTVIVFTGGTAETALGAADTLDGGDVLPGFRLPLANLFKD
jgi:Uma2 family endonuclease